MFNFLTHDDIYLVNQLTVKKHGGNYVPPKNLLNPERLDYLIGIVQNDLYYPTIEGVSGLYLYNVIANHIFQDGNKRTGLAAMLLFLRLNGKQLKPIKNKDLYNFIIEVASGKRDYETCAQWITQNTQDVVK